MSPQIPKLACYSVYCSNQIYAKEVLDRLSLKPDVADFLERCRTSSFSRKLDLWSFLDSPRRRLPKVWDCQVKMKIQTFVTTCKCLETHHTFSTQPHEFTNLTPHISQYVLLIKNIIKMTVPTHPDKIALQRSIELLHSVLATVDKATGEAKVCTSLLNYWITSHF